MKTINLALVGCGEFGSRWLDSLKTLPGVVVRWACDLDEAKARELAQRHGAQRSTADYREAFDDATVDAAIVVTPESAHRPVAVAALQRGKHVIVEKPLATTEEDGQAMVAAAEAAGKQLMTAFLLRFDYRYARLHQRLSTIGTIRNIYAWRNFDRALFELYSRTHSFVENAIHDIDLILWCLGDRAVKVHGHCRNTQGRENPDVNWGVIEFERGALAVLQTSWMYPRQPHDTLQWNAGLQVMGDRGVLEVRMDADGFRAHTEQDGQVVLDQTGWAVIHDEPRGAFGAMLRHFMSALRGDVNYAGATPQEAIASMRIACDLAADARRRLGETA